LHGSYSDFHCRSHWPFNPGGCGGLHHLLQGYIREPGAGHGIEMRPVVFLGGMFGLLGYIIFGVFFVLSCVAKFMAFKHLGPKWIERFVLSNRSS
jgi:hypothetical protein